jgi:hypothetical protein
MIARKIDLCGRKGAPMLRTDPGVIASLCGVH